MALDPETEERIEQPVAPEAEREIRLTPAQAIERMKINVPARGNRKLRQLLAGLYEEPELTVVVSEVLHAITTHRDDGRPLTLEAGIVRVADALDMAEGRSRIPFERGSVSIHSLSAAAIEDVIITDGDNRPIGIEIVMNNSSGIYQVDELLRAKLRGSRLEPYVDGNAHIQGEAEKLLLPSYRLET